MKKRLRRWWRELRRDAMTDGAGLYGNHGSASWGGCTMKATLRGHHCTGHVTDAQPWQHRCPCGFRWAEAEKEAKV